MKKNLLNSIYYVVSVAFAVVLITLTLAGCSKDDDAKPKTTGIKIKNIDPESPSNLKYYKSAIVNDRVTITYDYVVTEPNGARIWIQPISNNGGEYSILYSPSPVLKGSGSKTVIVSIESDENQITVDQLRIVIKDPETGAVISETFKEVNFTFSK